MMFVSASKPIRDRCYGFKIMLLLKRFHASVKKKSVVNWVIFVVD